MNKFTVGMIKFKEANLQENRLFVFAFVTYTISPEFTFMDKPFLIA